jgi:hypothetical protein
MKSFLSSTYVDLIEYRQAATEALERLGQQVGRMEIFGARPVEPSNACLSEIEDCDLYCRNLRSSLRIHSRWLYDIHNRG